LIRRLLLALGAALVVLLTVLVVRTVTFSSRQLTVEPVPAVAVDTAGAAERLAAAIRIPTVSREGATHDAAAFASLHDHLERSFPRLHATLRVERILDHSLLLTWQGTDPSLPPALLMAHQDVVPVEPGTEAGWTYPPFEGRIADGFIWGRGALDNKSGVLGIMEAVEMLLAEGFRPRRTVLLAFGHDEEIGGTGAQATAALLAERGVRLAWVLDEGGAIMEPGTIPGLRSPVAVIGVAEKGYLSLRLSTEQAGGHSSQPPRQTAVGIVAAAVARLEARPFPGALRGATREMFAYLGPEMPPAQRLVFANTWLFAPLIERQLAAAPATDATLRTTTAATMFQGSVKDNVLPIHAHAVVNFRILPGETVASVVERVRRTVHDPRVEIAEHGGMGTDPSPVSPSSAEPFALLHRTVRQVVPDAVVAPYLVLGATDARHYGGLSDHVFRFLPLRLTQQDLRRMHGTDERIGVRDHARAIVFYRQLIRNGT
jgi:carboxypeptidase PM20D1